MKRYIKSSYDKMQGPRKYVYDICDYLGWNYPTFIDPAAGGYAVKFNNRPSTYIYKNNLGEGLDKEGYRKLYRMVLDQLMEDDREDLERVKEAGKVLGIPIIRPTVKAVYGYGGLESRIYFVVPRYDG